MLKYVTVYHSILPKPHSNCLTSDVMSLVVALYAIKVIPTPFCICPCLTLQISLLHPHKAILTIPMAGIGLKSWQLL